MYDVIVKSSRSLSHLLMSFLFDGLTYVSQCNYPLHSIAMVLALKYIVIVIIDDYEAAGYIISVLSVCLSVRRFFRKPCRRKFIFAHPVYLQGIRAKFVYEGHRVKIKVTGANKVENSYSRNVKLRSAITLVL